MNVPLFSLVFACAIQNSASKLTKIYDHSTFLDKENKSVKFSWKYDNRQDVLFIGLEVKATGWVGIGFAHKIHKMVDYDVVVGKVEYGKGTLTDRYTKGYTEPPADVEQDYNLTHSEEVNGTTTLEFHRKRLTGDSKDIDIKLGPMLVVYAYHSWSDYPLPYQTQHDHQGYKTVEVLSYDTVLPGNLTSSSLKTSPPLLSKTTTKTLPSVFVSSTSSSLSPTSSFLSLMPSTSIVSAVQLLSTSSSVSLLSSSSSLIPMIITSSLTATRLLSSSSTKHFSSQPTFSIRSPSSTSKLPQPSSSTGQSLSSPSSTPSLLHTPPSPSISSSSTISSSSPSSSSTSKLPQTSLSTGQSLPVSSSSSTPSLLHTPPSPSISSSSAISSSLSSSPLLVSVSDSRMSTHSRLYTSPSMSPSSRTGEVSRPSPPSTSIIGIVVPDYNAFIKVHLQIKVTSVKFAVIQDRKGPEFMKFKTNFESNIAKRERVWKVIITNIRPGSVLVDFDILVNSSSQRDAQVVIDDIKQEKVSGKFGNFSVDPNYPMVAVITMKVKSTSAPSILKQSNEDKYLVAIIVLGCAVGILLIATVFLALQLMCYKRQEHHSGSYTLETLSYSNQENYD